MSYKYPPFSHTSPTQRRTTRRKHRGEKRNDGRSKYKLPQHDLARFMQYVERVKKMRSGNPSPAA